MVTVLQATSLTLKMARGATYTVKLATATRVYRILRVAPEQFFAGMSVTVRTTTVGGRQQAVEAIQRTDQPGAVGVFALARLDPPCLSHSPPLASRLYRAALASPQMGQIAT